VGLVCGGVSSDTVTHRYYSEDVVVAIVAQHQPPQVAREEELALRKGHVESLKPVDLLIR